MTWTLPSLCLEPRRPDSWVRQHRGSKRRAPPEVVVASSHIKCVFLPGEALLESNTVIDFVYCSPSLRCVQTAQNILKGQKSLRIRDRPTFPRLVFFCVTSRVCVSRSAAGQQAEGASGTGAF